MSVDTAVEQILKEAIPGETPVIQALMQMHVGVQGKSGLDDRTFMLVRLAALVAIDAPVESYLVNLVMAEEVGVSADEVRGVLIALAPLVGSARVLSGSERAIQAVIGASRM